MLPQGVLGFQYEDDRSSTGVISLAGLPLHLDLVRSSGLVEAIRQHVQVAGGQGWLDIQMVLAVVFLNLAGGDCVEDLERLERDSGFIAVLQAVERDLLSRCERRSLKRRWRRERERTVPSPLNCWWAEQGAMLYSEFRDGNVPAGHEQLRVLQDSLRYLPAKVTTVSLRSDTAGYQEELLLYCGEGKDPRF